MGSSSDDVLEYDNVNMEAIFKKMEQKLEEKFETILEQKNLIINEFREKIELLNDKISMLNKLKYYEDLQKDPASANLSDSNKKTTKEKTNSGKQAELQQSAIINPNKVLHALMVAQTTNKLEKIINLESDKLDNQNPSQINQAINSAILIKLNEKTTRELPENSNNKSAAELRKWCYVGNLHSKTTKEALEDHFKALNIDQTTCEKLPSKNEFQTGFKASVLPEDIDTLINPEHWPVGAVIKPFWFQKTHNRNYQYFRTHSRQRHQTWQRHRGKTT